MHLGAPNCSLPLPQGVGWQPLHTALHSRREQSSQLTVPWAWCLLPGQGFFFFWQRLFWSLVSSLPSHPRTGLGAPFGVCCTSPLRHSAQPPWGRLFPVGRRDSIYIPHCPALSHLFYMPQGPASASVPFTRAQFWTNYAPFTEFKTFGA